MAGKKVPGPVCGATVPSDAVEDGTLCRAPSPPPGPVGTQDGHTAQYVTPAFKVAIDIPFSIAPHMTWDAYQRALYEKLNEAIQRQANLMQARGNATFGEVKELVDQRNRLVLETRNRLSPFGRLYSEILKPSGSLKTTEQFIAEKGSIEAVLRSVGKTRQVVNRLSVVSRVAGPALIVLDVTMTAVVIYEAPAKDRGRVAAREIGGAAGGIGGGIGGGWAGCATAALLVSPSLTIPIVGEVSEGAACFVGGIMGGAGAGYLGRRAGSAAGEGLYDFVTELTWVRQ